MKLGIVIVNYRCAELTIACLGSLAGQVDGACVSVVDNDSQDGSAESIAAAIESHGWSWARLIRAERNGGFAYGNNLAIRAWQDSGLVPDYVLLLNPDCEARPGALRPLVEFLDAHPDVGVVGSRLEDQDGTPQHSRFRFSDLVGEFVTPSHLSIWRRVFPNGEYTPPLVDEPHEIDWVSGAAMMMRRQVIEAIGLMDEGYFLYFEEQDYQLRARQAGFSVWYVPASRIVHYVSGSTRNFPRGGRPARRPRYWFESRYRFFVKHRGRAYLWVTNLAWIASHSVATVKRLLQRRASEDPPHMLSDFARYSFFAPRGSRRRGAGGGRSAVSAGEGGA